MGITATWAELIRRGGGLLSPPPPPFAPIPKCRIGFRIIFTAIFQKISTFSIKGYIVDPFLAPAGTENLVSSLTIGVALTRVSATPIYNNLSLSDYLSEPLPWRGIHVRVWMSRVCHLVTCHQLRVHVSPIACPRVTSTHVPLQNNHARHPHNNSNHQQPPTHSKQQYIRVILIGPRASVSSKAVTVSYRQLCIQLETFAKNSTKHQKMYIMP